VFVNGKFFQLGLMFVGKARSLPYSGTSGRCFTGVGSRLTSKHKSRLKSLPGTSPLDYYKNL
jgi:hypothetical protein